MQKMFTYFEENFYDNLSKVGHKNPSEYAPCPNMRPQKFAFEKHASMGALLSAVYGIITKPFC